MRHASLCSSLACHRTFCIVFAVEKATLEVVDQAQAAMEDWPRPPGRTCYTVQLKRPGRIKPSAAAFRVLDTPNLAASTASGKGRIPSPTRSRSASSAERGDHCSSFFPPSPSVPLSLKSSAKIRTFMDF
jgi:hypothetical protein